MENKKEKSIETDVLNKIEKGEVKMHSKTFFTLKNVLLALSILATLFITVYLFSFILFAGFRSGLWFLPLSFGIIALLMNFPWLILLLFVLFAILLEYLLNRYSISYKRPLLYSLIFIFLLISILGCMSHTTNLHGYIYQKNVPIITNMYDNFDLPCSGRIHRGAVLQINRNGFLLNEEEGDTTNVVYVESANIPKRIIKDIEIGDGVVVFGQENNENIIMAIGVHEIPERVKFPPQQPKTKKCVK